MNKNIIPAGIALALVLGVGAVGCSSNDRVEDFKRKCDKANGKVVRENDLGGFENMAFSKPAPKPAKPKTGKAKVKAPKVATIPKEKSSSKPKPKKSKKGDNDYLCVDGDNIMFEMDE